MGTHSYHVTAHPEWSCTLQGPHHRKLMLHSDWTPVWCLSLSSQSVHHHCRSCVSRIYCSPPSPVAQTITPGSAQTCWHPKKSTYLAIAVNVDGVVVRVYKEKTLWICTDQQCEWWMDKAGILGEEQEARARQLKHMTVKSHHKLVCHQQGLVFG